MNISIFFSVKFDYFLINLLKHILWVSHWGGSFEYPQHMFWLRNKKYNFLYQLLSVGLRRDVDEGPCLNLGL